MFKRPSLALGDALREWDSYMGVSGASESTRRNYRYAMVRFLADTALLHPNDPRVDEGFVVRYLSTLPPRGFMRDSIIKALRSYYSFALRRRWVPANPVVELKPGRRVHREAPSLTDDELRRLFRAAFHRSHRRGWTLMFIYATGCRRGSALGVRVGDVYDGRVHFRQSKGNRPYSVPLGRMARIAVRHLIEDPVANGLPIGLTNANTLSNWVTEASRDAGVPGWTHLLRHAALTRVAYKTDPRSWLAVSNHSSLSEYKRYVHSDEDRVKDALEDL